MQSRLQRSGEPYRPHERGVIQRDHGFGGAARGLRADSAANENHIVVLEEDEFAAFVSALDAGPTSDQSAYFALQRGHDGEFRHIRWSGTNLLPGAVHHRRERSSIPAR